MSPTDNPDIRYSLKGISRDEVDKGKKKRHNKKRFYNEADTLFMQWSNSPSVPVGEREIFKRGKEWAFFKKTKDGCVELFRSKSKEVVREYERTYSEANNKIYGNSESIRSDQGRDIWNMRIPRNGGNDDGNVGQIGSKEFQADAEADEGHLLSGNRGISDVTDSEGNELSEGQRKFFKNSNVRDEDGNLLVVYHGTDADFTVSDTKTAQAMLATIGVQSSEVSRLLELSIDSISQTGDDVKYFSDIDSEETKNSLKRSDFNKTIDKDKRKAHNKKGYTTKRTRFLCSGQTARRCLSENAKCLSEERNGLFSKRQKTAV